jgi:hypothetical protein
MLDVQKVPAAKAVGNVVSQEIKKTVNLFYNNSNFISGQYLSYQKNNIIKKK